MKLRPRRVSRLPPWSATYKTRSNAVPDNHLPWSQLWSTYKYISSCADVLTARQRSAAIQRGSGFSSRKDQAKFLSTDVFLRCWYIFTEGFPCGQQAKMCTCIGHFVLAV